MATKQKASIQLTVYIRNPIQYTPLVSDYLEKRKTLSGTSSLGKTSTSTVKLRVNVKILTQPIGRGGLPGIIAAHLNCQRKLTVYHNK